MLLTQHEICMISSHKYLINAMVLWNSDMFIYSQFPAMVMLSWLSFHSFIGVTVNMSKVFDTYTLKFALSVLMSALLV